MTPKQVGAVNTFIQNKEKQKYKDMDIQAWLTGLYVQRAVSSCFSKDATYPESPLGVFDSKEEIEAKKAKAIEDKRNAFIEMFKQKMNDINENFKEK